MANMVADPLCPLCRPALLERPRLNWSRYRNCAKHQEPIDMVISQQQQRRQDEAAPEQRSIIQRFEAAAQLLLEQRVNLTPAQEQAFLEKLWELQQVFDAEHPGMTPPLARYDRNALLEIRWPEGWHKLRIEDAERRRKAMAEAVGLGR